MILDDAEFKILYDSIIEVRNNYLSKIVYDKDENNRIYHLLKELSKGNQLVHIDNNENTKYSHTLELLRKDKEYIFKYSLIPNSEIINLCIIKELNIDEALVILSNKKGTEVRLNPFYIYKKYFKNEPKNGGIFSGKEYYDKKILHDKNINIDTILDGL